MEAFSALLAICAENSPVTGEFPTQRPVTRCFDVFFHVYWCLRRHRAHYDVIVMIQTKTNSQFPEHIRQLSAYQLTHHSIVVIH